jgi:hypothetical protein
MVMNLEESGRMYNLDQDNIRLREQLQQERERLEKYKKVLYSVKDCLETLRFDIEEENSIDWFTSVHIRQELAKIKRISE